MDNPSTNVMKTYTPPTLQLIKLRPAQTLLSLSGTHDEVGNGVQYGDELDAWEQTDWGDDA